MGARSHPLSALSAYPLYPPIRSMRLAPRLFAVISEIAAGLEREARLITVQLPDDSTEWPGVAQRLGALAGHRVPLIAPDGRVLGDAEFDRESLGRLENHLHRPEVQGALLRGTGQARRLSESTNEQQLYVAVRGGPPGLAVVRVSATLASVG